MTPAAFLAWEEEQDGRWEFDGAAAVPRPGGTVVQALIAANLVALLVTTLAGTRWAGFGGTLRIAGGGCVRYPDAFVAARSLNPRATVVHDPIVVFEVLDRQTAATDLVGKIRAYEASPSLRHFVMLEQDRIGAAVFARERGGWRGRLFGRGDTLFFPAIGVRLKLAAVYAGLELPVPPGEVDRSGRRCRISVIVRLLREAIEGVQTFLHGGFEMARPAAARKSAAQARNRQPVEAPEEPPEEVAEELPAVAPFVVALDVGYSNLKLLAGARGSTPTAILLPAGSGPTTALQEPSRRGRGKEGLEVLVDGTAWAAGVEPSWLQNWERELHPYYPTTAGYRALVYAALLAAGPERIDTLVTGLPVNQWQDLAQREALRILLAGIHKVTPARSVEVAEVQVLAQPAGAYFGFAASEPEVAEEARVLVVDAGFFSVDWALFDEGALRGANSGTSTAAVSLVLETAAGLIKRDHGGRIEPNDLERALRTGRESLLLFSRPVKLAPYLDEAAKQTAPVAVTAIRQSLRGERREVDVVLLAGGGAETYAEATRAVFPRARVVVPEQPVLANVRGFWLRANEPAT